MKFKALRTKKEPKEFIEFQKFGETWMVFSSELPNPQPQTADYEGLKEYYRNYCSLPENINLDDYELVEFEMFEVDTVGADIRNKLSPSLNLLSLLKLYFKEENDEMKAKLKVFIQKEMEKSEENIKYISNLL